MSSATIQINAFNAQAVFSDLLERVRRGATFTVVEDARASAHTGTNADAEAAAQARRDAAAANIRAFRETHRLNGLGIRSLIEEGRR